MVDVVSHRFQGQVFVGDLAADPVGLLHPGIQASRHPKRRIFPIIRSAKYRYRTWPLIRNTILHLFLSG